MVTTRSQLPWVLLLAAILIAWPPAPMALLKKSTTPGDGIASPSISRTTEKTPKRSPLTDGSKPLPKKAAPQRSLWFPEGKTTQVLVVDADALEVSEGEDLFEGDIVGFQHA